MGKIVLELDGNVVTAIDNPLLNIFKGTKDISRLSNVEFNNDMQTWYVQDAETGEILKDDFETRADALRWEHEYYTEKLLS